MALLNPKFLYNNDIESVDDLAISSGDNTANKLKLFDRNTDQFSRSSGETTGTRTIDWAPSAAMTIDTVYIQNCNWSTFTIKHSGGTDFSTPISVTTSTNNNFYFTFTPVSVTSVDISITLCQDEPAEVSTGQIYIGSEVFALDEMAGVNVQIKPRVEQRVFNLADGSTKKIYIRRTVNYSIDVEQASAAERANYKTVYDKNKSEAVVFLPQPRTLSDEWYGVGGHVNWVNVFEFENFSREIEANGYRGRVDLAQAGGL